MAIKSEYNKIQSYSTKDGSQIKELMHPEIHGNKRQSLAEACIPIGSTTLLHKHKTSEELYHIKSGRGLMTHGNEKFVVTTGDTIYIPPGTPHRIQTTGKETLKILCCCSPPYSHNDTKLLVEQKSKEE
jgi:mannose-6-phosphate isomerase-like protein (cupin superfamily)